MSGKTPRNSGHLTRNVPCSVRCDASLRRHYGCHVIAVRFIDRMRWRHANVSDAGQRADHARSHSDAGRWIDGVRPDERLLVFAGRPAREKRLDVLVGAVERLGAPYKLLFVGAGGGAPPAVW